MMTNHDKGANAHGAHEGRPAHLAHHFETPRQQFESGKLGMWLFLATEILFFGGLFCAYSVYRSNHPEIFSYASRFLDVFWGGLNTLILICSSLTMAWGVRNAQLGQRRALAVNLTLTMVFACCFLCIKYIEYSHKWHEGLLWGKYYNPMEHKEEEAAASSSARLQPDGSNVSLADDDPTTSSGPARADDATSSSLAAMPKDFEKTTVAAAAEAPGGLARFGGVESETEEHPEAATESESRSALARIAAFLTPVHHGSEPASRVQIFFSIYFFMTGLHGLHVIIGIMLIGWLLVRSLRGNFGPEYFTPVDLVGLYWHLVDMIWIYLFPLLYLIH